MAEVGELNPLPVGYDKLAPPALFVKDVGWRTFLHTWDDQALDLVKQRAFEVGIGLTESDNSFYRRELSDAHLTGFDRAFGPASRADEANAESTARRYDVLMRAAKALIAVQTLPSIAIRALSRQTLGFTAATEMEVSDAEARLGCRLPSSYKCFLAISNGWQMTDTPLLPVEQIGWYRDKEPDSASVWGAEAERYPISDEDYFLYGPSQKMTLFRREYVKDLLLISAMGDNPPQDILLNPRVILDNGQWEAWKIDPGGAGVSRFRSFEAMMTWMHLYEVAALRDQLNMSRG